MRERTLEPIPEEYGQVLQGIIFDMLTVNPDKRPDAKRLLDDLKIEPDKIKLRANMQKNKWDLPATLETYNCYYTQGQRIEKGRFNKAFIVQHIYEKKNYIAKILTKTSLNKALAEWKTIIKLDHDNIVGTKQCFFDECDEILTVVQELCDSEDLTSLIYKQ